MTKRIPSVVAALVAALAACSSDDSSSSTSSSSSSGGSSTSSTSSSSGSPSSGPNCGDATCDTKKEYCLLTAGKDANGNRTWTPSGCKPVPTGCTLPAPPETCFPSDCSAVPPPPECTTPPDTTKCSPSTFCSCVQKQDSSCPKTGLTETTCKQNNGVIGYGCTGQ